MESATGVLTVFYHCKPSDVPDDDDEVVLTTDPVKPPKGNTHYEFHPLRDSVTEVEGNGKHAKVKARWGDLMQVSHTISQK